MTHATYETVLLPPDTVKELVPNELGVGICNDAEPRLVKALADSAFVLVNGLMLIEVVGEYVGVPIREETLPGGTVERDAWYEIDYGPKDEGGPQVSEWWKRQTIEDAFTGGSSRLVIPGITKWFRLRSADTYRVGRPEAWGGIVQRAVDYLRDNTPMPGGIMRAEYLRRVRNYQQLAVW